MSESTASMSRESSAARRTMPNLNLTGAAYRPGSDGPPSPTLSASTRASQAFAGYAGADRPRVVVTRADLKQSVDAFQALLSSAKALRNALLTVATATASFAAALEDCARQKGASVPRNERAPFGGAGLAFDQRDESDDDSGESDVEPAPSEALLSAAGLHHVMANHQRVLADALYRQFELPLLDELDKHRASVAERQALYDKSVAEKTKRIRDIEAENMRNARKKQRDLSVFRKALASLQAQVDELDHAKAAYYGEVLDGETDLFTLIVEKASVVVRSEHELYDRVASKCLSDRTLDSMLRSQPDPFNAFDAATSINGERSMFSVLPPLKLLARTPVSGVSSPERVEETDEPETPRAAKERPDRRDLSVISEGGTSVVSPVDVDEGSAEDAATGDLPGGLGRSRTYGSSAGDGL